MHNNEDYYLPMGHDAVLPSDVFEGTAGHGHHQCAGQF